jgi:hypothetical protein
MIWSRRTDRNGDIHVRGGAGRITLKWITRNLGFVDADCSIRLSGGLSVRDVERSGRHWRISDGLGYMKT